MYCVPSKSILNRLDLCHPLATCMPSGSMPSACQLHAMWILAVGIPSGSLPGFWIHAMPSGSIQYGCCVPCRQSPTVGWGRKRLVYAVRGPAVRMPFWQFLSNTCHSLWVWVHACSSARQTRRHHWCFKRHYALVGCLRTLSLVRYQSSMERTSRLVFEICYCAFVCACTQEWGDEAAGVAGAAAAVQGCQGRPGWLPIPVLCRYLKRCAHAPWLHTSCQHKRGLLMRAFVCPAHGLPQCSPAGRAHCTSTEEDHTCICFLYVPRLVCHTAAVRGILALLAGLHTHMPYYACLTRTHWALSAAL